MQKSSPFLVYYVKALLVPFMSANPLNGTKIDLMQA